MAIHWSLHLHMHCAHDICTYVIIIPRGVSRIFIIGFPTSGVGRYFNRGGEAASDTQLNPGNLKCKRSPHS